MATPETTNILDEQWVCMACNNKFRLGQMKVSSVSERRPLGHGCPMCGDGRQIHPATGDTLTLDAYHGPRGTVQ